MIDNNEYKIGDVVIVSNNFDENRYMRVFAGFVNGKPTSVNFVKNIPVHCFWDCCRKASEKDFQEWYGKAMEAITND